MKSERVRNGLLFVIALCLVLIVLRLYSVDLVREAEALDRHEARLYGCLAGKTCTSADEWVPVRIDGSGRLLVE